MPTWTGRNGAAGAPPDAAAAGAAQPPGPRRFGTVQNPLLTRPGAAGAAVTGGGSGARGASPAADAPSTSGAGSGGSGLQAAPVALPARPAPAGLGGGHFAAAPGLGAAATAPPSSAALLARLKARNAQALAAEADLGRPPPGGAAAGGTSPAPADSADGAGTAGTAGTAAGPNGTLGGDEELLAARLVSHLQVCDKWLTMYVLYKNTFTTEVLRTLCIYATVYMCDDRHV